MVGRVVHVKNIISGSRVGCIYTIGNKGVQGVCKAAGHSGHCRCYVTLKEGEDRDAVDRSMLAWFAGSMVGITEGQHQASARELKVARGMRVRR